MPNLEYNFGDQKSTIFIAKIIKFHPDLWVFSMKRSARSYLVISQKRARFFSVNFIYIGGVYIYIYIYVYTLHCTALYIYIYIYIYCILYTRYICIEKKKKSNV